jgi:phosphatidylinositol alpha-1,6-mannosyltransferase
MLALVSDAFGGRGGIAQYNRDFLSAAAAVPAIDRIEIFPRHVTDDFASSPGIYQMPPGTSRAAYVLRALMMGLTKKADILFCGHINLAPLAAVVARLLRARLIVQTHGVEAWDRPGEYHRRAVEAADLVLCVSRYTRARLLSWASIAPEKVVVLPNTVGAMFSMGDSSVLRARWKLAGKRVLLTVARMDAKERYKGHERVIAALLEIPRDVVYVVLGDGDDSDRVKEAARAAGVGERVYFKGAVSRADVIAAYRLADIYVMPSTGEGFGIAFLEAMASGTPALGLAVAGATDALMDGVLGVAASDADFVAALKRLLAAGKPDGQALSDAVTARFGHDAFAARTRSALGRLLEF